MSKPETNRRRLLKSNPYDILVSMNEKYLKHTFNCIMNGFMSDAEKRDRCSNFYSCYACIAAYLDEGTVQK